MRKKIAGIIIVSLVLIISVIGCQQAAKKPFTNDTNRQTTNEMTENERRVLAGRLSNLAEEVDGVKKASVVVSDIAMTQNNPTTTPKAPTDNINTETTRRTTMPTNPGNTNVNTPGTPNINTPGITNMDTPNNSNNQTGVDNNTVNQTGLVVMVGITLDSNIKNDASRMETIKQTVADRLEGADTRISQVLVTGDPDLIKRINSVASGLLKGKPVNNFEKDIKNIGNDLQREMEAF